MRRIRIKKINEEINEPDDIFPEENIQLNTDENVNKKKIIIENIYKILIKASTFLLKTFVILFKVSGIYLLWICLHYFSAHLYVKFCVPNTFIGFFMSPFMMATPHCQGLRWIVYNAAGIINNMWILIGAWIYSTIWIFNRDCNIEATPL